MGSLYFEIEGQSCLVDSVDQGLMKIDKLTNCAARPKKEPEKEYLNRFSPITTVPDIFQQRIAKTSLEFFW